MEMSCMHACMHACFCVQYKCLFGQHLQHRHGCKLSPGDFRDRRLVLGGRLGTLHRLENGLLVDDVGGVAVGVALLSLDAPQHPANLLPQRRRPRPPRLHLRRQPVR
eukprot:349922-Chlamydomonas_euryale.AAC.1